MKVRHTPLVLDLSGITYQLGPDSVRRPGVAEGSVTEFSWDASAIYPSTSRRFWVYVPAQYDPAEPASLMVFLDGGGFLDADDDLRAAVVLDNLIDDGDLPPTIAVFVDPGTRDDDGPAPGQLNRQRNAEYDAFDARCAALLIEEIIPEVASRWSITQDHDRWVVCGFSSGGNAAFTAAWLRPETFGGVLCFSSSFAQMPGGNPYPALITETPPRRTRVLLQFGHRDLGWDEPHGNWLAENLRVGAALAEAGYDLRLVLGDGGHETSHAGAVLPDALRWVFRSSSSHF